jgi:F420-dependent oxidoreductase-like protein
MKIGLYIGKFDWSGRVAALGPKISEVAATADEVGFYSLWVLDHFFQLGERYRIIHGPMDANMLEGYSTLSFLAGVTREIKLGLMVTCAPYRPPGLLVKTISTLDVLSQGRTYLGLGAGWFEGEAEGLGLPLPLTWTERFERLEGTLQIAKLMWAGDSTPYNGKHYQLAEPINQPQPLSRPHPPILIGGSGERKTLRLVAQYADACNFVIGYPNEEFGSMCQPLAGSFEF